MCAAADGTYRIFTASETKGISLEGMDIVFGAVTKEEREAEIARRANAIEKAFEDEEKGVATHREAV